MHGQEELSVYSEQRGFPPPHGAAAPPGGPGQLIFEASP